MAHDWHFPAVRSSAFTYWQEDSSGWNESVDERQRLVRESSEASFSSSCSSSFSSMEFNQESQPEASSFDRILLSRTPWKCPDSYLRLERQPLDLRDAVKESMYREARKLPVKGDEDKPVGNSVKNRNGSSKVVIQRPSWEAKDQTWNSCSRNVPRFSYLGKERNRLSFEVVKSASIREEVPRLTGDCREGSVNSGHRKRVPSVVAKLMGLEALPASGDKPSNMSSLIRTIKTADPSTNPAKELSSVHRKSADRTMKPIQTSKLPLEIAPWSPLDGNQGIQKPSFQANSSPSVYGDIEERLKNIVFNQSGKDLRALKQILEAIPSKREDGSSNMNLRKDYQPKSASPRQNTRVICHQNKHGSQVIGLMAGEPDSSQVLKSPIVVIKPAKFTKKVGILVSSVISKGGYQQLPDCKENGSSRAIKDQSPKNSFRDSSSTSSEKRPRARNVSPPQSSSRSQQFSNESTAGSMKSSGSSSPRLQQKKPEKYKRSRPPAPPDSSKPRSASSGNSKRQSSNLLQSDYQLSETSKESRTLSYLGIDISQNSDKNLSSGPKMNTEKRSMEKNTTLRYDEAELQLELVMASQEHPSPVSVLDTIAYRYDELFSVKKISNSLEVDHALDGDNYFVEDRWRSKINLQKLQNIDNLVQKLRRLNSHHDESKTDHIASLCENMNPDFRYISEILLASGLLLHDLSSSIKTFRLHPSDHLLNPELFSGLEKTEASSLSSSQEGNNLRNVGEKFHRKLIFDAVNEILTRKLQSNDISSKLWSIPNRVSRKTPTAQRLLKELCCEIERFRADEDVGFKNLMQVELMIHGEIWTNFHDEVSGTVLDVERLIFKSLLDEIVKIE